MFPDTGGGVSGNGGTDNISGSDTSDNVSGNQGSLNMLNAGTFLKAFGSLSTGYADYQSLQSKASADRFNSTIASNNAQITGQESASNEAALRLKQDREIGQQRANAAEAGVGPISEGSAGEAIRQSQVDANFQALVDRYRGTVQRTNFLNEANLDNYYADVAKKNSKTSLFNTGFSTTSKLLEGFGRYQQGVI